MIEIINTNALEWLENAAANGPRFDCIITDPPYWTLNKWRNIGTTTRLGGHRNKDEQNEDRWFETIDRDDLWSVLIAFDQLIKNNSHTYIMCDHEVVSIILGWVRESGELSWNYSKPLIWDKINSGMGYHWRATHEYIVMLEKGKRRLNNLGMGDILRHKRVTGKYPTEKPLSLIEDLLLNSTKEGDWVIDPFCGSGVVGEACKKHNRNCVLIDLSERAINITKNRLAEPCQEKLII